MVDRVLQKYHQIHVLVNNAAIMKVGSLLETEPDEIRRVLDIDLLAYFWVRILYFKKAFAIDGITHSVIENY